jgi:hypothetical protein
MWVHAKVVTANNQVIQNDSLFFNFNKLTQSLLITQDFRKIFEVDKSKFESVTFFVNDTIYIFEHVNTINKRDFFQELIRDDNKYSLYKFTLTTIKPVDYHSNGFVTEGNDYVEFLDNSIYYIVITNKEYRVLKRIDKKSIEKAFKLSNDGKKTADWLSAKNKINGENDLSDLVLYLNE